jgi:ABC-2 type transport system ATP-binding protein
MSAAARETGPATTRKAGATADTAGIEETGKTANSGAAEGSARENDAPIIDVTGLTKSFDGRKVVDDFSIRAHPGRIYGFLGPNGSGKTTAIRMLCGLLRPDAGEGTCLGHDIRRDSAAIKREVGYMTQRFGLYEDLTIAENLDFIARAYGVANRRQVVEETLQQLGLRERGGQLAGKLSGGWKQRLALAACLLHQPRLLLLDEPTAGVDPKARRDFWAHIHRLAADGLTVLVSTHYMDEAERCHELIYLAYGRVMVRGTADEVIRGSGLVTWAITGPSVTRIEEDLRRLPSVRITVPFGTTLHVSGDDAAALERDLTGFVKERELRAVPISTGLEDVFISLMEKAQDNYR